ncbi:HEAT repeat domain-containing protein [Pleionea mediterranea]|uniref:HEAT repeat protein n=1 Tax=Pleionea mediterranea TaxID=523701 RepID=A0A316G0F6_9GAMM|nr:HEAT repeat domain-containing protein [Pleionea mediterranea]PWK53446.1 hypothetical protein C8D97_103273 [Pleionea mediterranea]
MGLLSNINNVFSSESIELVSSCANDTWLSKYLKEKIKNSSLSLGDVKRAIDTLDENEKFVLRTSVISTEDLKSSLVLLAERDCLLSLFGGAQVQVDYYSAIDSSKNNYDRIVKKTDTRIYSDGESIKLKKGKSFYRIQYKISGLIMSLLSKESMPETFKYNADTGKLANVSASEMLHSKLDFACNLLARFPRKNSLPTLKRLVQHDVHFVRWSATQAYAKIAETSETKLLLTNLVNDPHPHIRNAVSYSLANLFSEQQ